MSFDEVCAALVREPFHLTMRDIARLTPYQLQQIYLRDDPNGLEGIPEGGEPCSPFKALWLHLKPFGYSDQAIVDRWRQENPQYADQAVVDPGWRPPLHRRPPETA